MADKTDPQAGMTDGSVWGSDDELGRESGRDRQSLPPGSGTHDYRGILWTERLAKLGFGMPSHSERRMREVFEEGQCETETYAEHLYNCALMERMWDMGMSEPYVATACRDTFGLPLSDLLARLADQGRNLDKKQVTLMAWLGGERPSRLPFEGPGPLEQFTHDEIDAMAWLSTVRIRRKLLPGILEGLPPVATAPGPGFILPASSATSDPSGTPWTERVVEGFVPHSCGAECVWGDGSSHCDDLGVFIEPYPVCTSETTAEHNFNRRQLRVWFHEWYETQLEPLAARGCERALGVPLSRLLSVLADGGTRLRKRDFFRLAHVGGPLPFDWATPPRVWAKRPTPLLPQERERLVGVMARLLHRRFREVAG